MTVPHNLCYVVNTLSSLTTCKNCTNNIAQKKGKSNPFFTYPKYYFDSTPVILKETKANRPFRSSTEKRSVCCVQNRMSRTATVNMRRTEGRYLQHNTDYVVSIRLQHNERRSFCSNHPCRHEQICASSHAEGIATNRSGRRPALL